MGVRIEIPQICWEVSWCLGWNIKDWSIDEITYTAKTGDIIKIKCHRPHRSEIFNSDYIKNNIFFDYGEAMQYLREKENSGDGD